MKKYIILISLVCFSLISNAQINNPAKWTYTAKKISATEYELHLTVNLQSKWHIYAQDIKGDGPVPTSFVYDKNPIIKFEGAVKEVGKLEKSYDKNFKIVLKYYENKVDFVQKVTIKRGANTIAKGKLIYMLCNDEKCLAPTTLPFSIKINAKG